MENALLKFLVKRWEQLSSQRAPWESQWQEIRDLVNPNASDFNRKSSPGSRKTDKILDGTAPWALEQLASGLHAFLTSPSDRWFSLCIKGYDYTNDAAALAWLEKVSDLIYDTFSDPRSNTDDSLHECYSDLGSFGTSVVYEDYNIAEAHVQFRTYPLADCRILENSKGTVDTVFREVMMTTRQVQQEFPDVKAEKIEKEKNPDKEWCVIHAVFPRDDRNSLKMDNKNKKFASFYFCKEADTVFSEGGYDEFPYHVPRWVKRAGEVYGRSPGMTCLPDIKMLNAMEKVQLKSCQKLVDPPLLVPNDGFMLPIITIPGGLTYYEENGTPINQRISPLETKARVEVGEEKMEQKRQHIMRCFYADWITRMKKRERQTATEIMDDREEMLQLMSPILGRLQTELLGPMITRTYNLLLNANRIPPSPSSIQKRTLIIVYISPAAKAQIAAKGLNIRRFTEELVAFAPVAPDIMDAIDPDAYAQEMARLQDVSRKILRDPAEVAKIRENRKQQQAAQAAAETAQPAAAAMKDIATAKEKGLDLSNFQLNQP